MTATERGELRTSLEHIERAKSEVQRASLCHAPLLDDVQRELLAASAALTRARAASLRGKPATEVQPQPEVRR
jgi:hypothetical protein